LPPPPCVKCFLGVFEKKFKIFSKNIKNQYKRSILRAKSPWFHASR